MSEVGQDCFMIFRYFPLLVSLQLYRTARATHPLITLSLTIGLLFASTVILVRKVSKSMDVWDGETYEKQMLAGFPKLLPPR